MHETPQPTSPASEAHSPAPVLYHGETARRSKVAAALLTALHPALGYLYVGKGPQALAASIFFTIYLVVFLIAWVFLQFFPLLPLAAVIFGWLTLAAACLVGILKEADASGENYVLKGSNHPVVYTVVFVLIGIVPFYALYFSSTQVLWGIVKINDNTMYPTLVPGDTLLVDRMAFVPTLPERGDKVVVKTEDGLEGRVALSRVVAVPGDRVRVERGSVVINDVHLERQYFGDDGVLPEEAYAGEPVAGASRAYVEDNHGRKYIIAGDLLPRSDEEENEPTVVSEGNLLLLSDNRAEVGAAPFVTVASANVLGLPRYILYSRTPTNDADEKRARTRWSRIGLRAD